MHVSLRSQLTGYSLLQMPSLGTENRKVLTDTVKAYRRQQHYIHYHCQLGHVTPGNALLVSVCLLMLPVLGLTTEHVQLATMYHNHWHVHRCHKSFHNAPLVLPSLSDILSAMGIQNELARSNAMGPSPYSSTYHTSLNPAVIVTFGLERMVVGLGVMALLLLMSGDVEINPGPVGKCTL